jgi:Na+/proline symporter
MVGMKGFLVELRGGTALSLALFMIFMAKWHRRSGAMTIAEWMEFRFGNNLGARAARLVAAVAVVILVVGMMTYFCVGFGKFLALFFPWDATTCSIIFTTIATVHILFSGLYGVAFTDVLQGVMILFVVIYISVLAVTTQIPMETIQDGWTALGLENMTWDKWTSIKPSWTMNFPAGYEAYDAFGFLLVFWILRMFLEGFGGPLVPYASQRFFAARTDREASLTTATSLGLFVIRWPLIIGIAILGLGLGSAIPADAEMIFPTVLFEYFPVGIRALVVSCMVAAAMSTFDSTVNAGGAYVVNDIYRRFIHPDASPRILMRLSWVATIGLTVICLLLASQLESINDIWSWLSMGLFGGMAVPFILRWYWQRFNGWGYAVGTLVGVGAAIIQKLIWPELSEAGQLGIISVISLVACITATYATAPTARETVDKFYQRTRPFGFWKAAKAEIPATELTAIRAEHRRDLLSILPAVLFFFFLFLTPMYAVVGDWAMTILTLGVVAVSGAVLYFTWYRHLGDA